MKLSYLMLVAAVYCSYGTFTYAATKGMDHHDAFLHFGHHENHGHKAYYDDDHDEFKDNLKMLIKNHHHFSQNLFLRICNKEKVEHDYVHEHSNGQGVKEPSVGQVPVPAAVWLFGSALMGLVGVKRKKA